MLACLYTQLLAHKACNPSFCCFGDVEQLLWPGNHTDRGLATGSGRDGVAPHDSIRRVDDMDPIVSPVGEFHKAKALLFDLLVVWPWHADVDGELDAVHHILNGRVLQQLIGLGCRVCGVPCSPGPSSSCCQGVP